MFIHRGLPSMGSAAIIDISCRVTVISPVRRWKLCVSGLQRSTSAVMADGFMLGVDRLTKDIHGRSPSFEIHFVYRSSYGILFLDEAS
jgi:hypothetical protein